MAHTDLLRIGAAAVLSSAAGAHSQMTWFVDADAPPGGDGLAWATAFDDLQPAMELALPGDQIWLAEGVYVPSAIDPIAGEDQPYFLMPDGVALLGGFRGDETAADQRDPETYESVISGDLLGNDLDTPVTGQFDSSPEMQALYQSKLDNTGTLLFVDRTGPGTVIDGLVLENAFTDEFISLGSPRGRNGVFVLGAIADFRGCTFRDNLGGVGGALYVYACGPGVRLSLDDAFLDEHPCGLVSVQQPSAVLVEDSLFLDNYSDFGIGGPVLSSALVIAGSVALIDETTFEFSRVNSQGFASNVGAQGLLIGDGSDATILNSMFRGCAPIPLAANGISAIGVGVSGTGEPMSVAEIDSCLFESNFAAEFGVVRFQGKAGRVIRSRFAGNRRFGLSFGAGGSRGVAVGAVTDLVSPAPPFLSVTDNLFIGNTSGDGAFDDDVPIVATAIMQGTIARNTFVSNTTNGPTIFLFNPDTNKTVVENNLIAGESPVLDPLFVRNPDDGGNGWGDDPSTPDVDESLNDDYGDLRLTAGSPAIDAGSTFFDTDTILDLAGNDRYVDDPGIPGEFIDLGAYEFQGVTCLPDVNLDGVVSPADFSAWITAFNDNSPLADQNRDGAVTPADFSAWIMNFNAGCP